jgi:hypothetical protein
MSKEFGTDVQALVNALQANQLGSANDARTKPTFPKEASQIPKFAGEPEELVNAWLRDYVKTTLRLDWTDADRAKNVEFYLAGTARTWSKHKYRKAPPASWKEFCDDLRQEFCTVGYRKELVGRLAASQQRRDETAARFADRLQDLCDEVDENMDEEMRVEYFVTGLRYQLSVLMMSNVGP